MNINSFKTSFQSALQDLLLVVYLTQVTKAQVLVAEKITSISI